MNTRKIRRLADLFLVCLTLTLGLSLLIFMAKAYMSPFYIGGI